MKCRTLNKRGKSRLRWERNILGLVGDDDPWCDCDNGKVDQSGGEHGGDDPAAALDHDRFDPQRCELFEQDSQIDVAPRIFIDTLDSATHSLEGACPRLARVRLRRLAGRRNDWPNAVGRRRETAQ